MYVRNYNNNLAKLYKSNDEVDGSAEFLDDLKMDFDDNQLEFNADNLAEEYGEKIDSCVLAFEAFAKKTFEVILLLFLFICKIFVNCF